MTELSIISVIYEGIEYDITNKIDNHPGPDIIRQILRNRKDISGYFKYNMLKVELFIVGRLNRN